MMPYLDAISIPRSAVHRNNEILRPEPRLQHQENVISMKVDLVKSLSIRRPRPPRIRTASTRR